MLKPLKQIKIATYVKNQYYLEDRMKARFPLIHDGNCNLRILHSKTLNLIAYTNELHDLGLTCRIHLTTENKEESEFILKSVLNKKQKKPLFFNSKTMTYGRFLS